MEHETTQTSSVTKTIVLTALFAAMATVATMVLAVPSPTGGYFNCGDAVILLGSYLLGPVAGAVAGGVGAMLADILGGYAAYAPGTLVIKAIVALVGGSAYRLGLRKTWGILICGALGELCMVVGYTLYDAWLLHSMQGSLVGVPMNLAQGAFGMIVSTLLMLALRKNAAACREFPHL